MHQGASRDTLLDRVAPVERGSGARAHLIADLGIVNYDCAEPSVALRRAVFCNQSCAACGGGGASTRGSGGAFSHAVARKVRALALPALGDRALDSETIRTALCSRWGRASGAESKGRAGQKVKT
jgi:hypothetical protein